MWKESHRVHCGEKVGTEAEAHGTHTALLSLQTSFNLQPCNRHRGPIQQALSG